MSKLQITIIGALMLMVLLFCVILTAGGIFLYLNKTYKVTYIVVGSANITYINETGARSQDTANGKDAWVYTFKGRFGDNLYVSSQANTGSKIMDYTICSIMVDAVEVQKATGSGAFGVATCQWKIK